MTNIAVILAGGIGKRAGEGLPKQLRTLADGRTVLQTCVEAFRACRQIDRIMVVMHPDWMEQARQLLPEDIVMIAGGEERWESSWNAIRFIINRFTDSPIHQLTDTNILLHDCARPFVSQRILNDVCAALEQHEAVTVAVPATDTMYRVKTADAVEPSNGCKTVLLSDIPDRATMYRAQTPQAFRLSTIRQAYEIALQAPRLQATDDCGIVHKYLPQTSIYVIAGEEGNRKLTFREDFVN
ncbi:MAG: 2-C-methyl-D-erythritol 4-phosphate cytidylyltransferase [Paludibacteraceae bacterium]|nr:2-C-methyl-D-erythritol 4-phosphate cytidylyltransferase [Paludibacteraceae bacterium]